MPARCVRQARYAVCFFTGLKIVVNIAAHKMAGKVGGQYIEERPGHEGKYENEEAFSQSVKSH